MKNAASLKSKPDTPKTPGGISKSLLTPCRRVGLSKNWKKSTISPFNSPLSSVEIKQENVGSRKRKESLGETQEETATTNQNPNAGTPSRKVEIPRKKKSKTLRASITNTELPPTPEPDKTEDQYIEESIDRVEIAKDNELDETDTLEVNNLTSKSKSKEVVADAGDSTVPEIVSTPVRRLKSKSKSKKEISPKSIKIHNKADSNYSSQDIVTEVKENEVFINKLTDKMVINDPKNLVKDVETSKKKNKEIVDSNKSNIIKEISPNNLTKECVVVIQKRIFKKELKEHALSKLNNSENKPSTVSQTLFDDSDSDDVPLNRLNNTEKTEGNVVVAEDDKHDSAATFKPKKETSFTKTSNKKLNSNLNVTKENVKDKTVNDPTSQTSFDDDDEDDLFDKRTILIRKSYDKGAKPTKARSTGSITQRDIEDLRARIKKKEKMLLAKSMPYTKELREVIKKWQKASQDALMKLMDLMKNKCLDQNTEYSQILETLNIPASLVGYDSDNDCFVTPEDENIILSHIRKC